MTSAELDSLQTNEFLRRRKLRFQQVREQSKDVAKKVRQRAKVEKLRQVVELDSKKQKEYLLRQERLVKRLEEYYAQGVNNVGSSHKHASEVQLQDEQGDRVDLSKQRGKEAAAELRKKRQHILDKQKKILDRKLQAREAANEISREKSTAVLNKLQPKPANKGTEDIPSKVSVESSEKDNKTKHAPKKDKDVARNDMATQWDLEEMPNEWEPNIPILALPKDDNSVKESNNDNVDSKSDKSKRLDLFALSDEMPSSLRGGFTNQEERVAPKSSLTLVSEYLQNRGLRLRESNTAHSNKKTEDLQSLKQTILRTRASKEGIMNLCHVHDEELVPVPTWRAENDCGFCPHSDSLHSHYDNNFTITSSMHYNHKYSLSSANPNFPNINLSSIKSAHPDLPSKKIKSIKPDQVRLNKQCTSKKLTQTDTMSINNNCIKPVHPDLLPSPVLRGASPFRRNRDMAKSFSAKRNIDRGFKSSTESTTINKKSSVTMYNHSTRDCRDVPYNDERLVVRESQADDDAYSQAMKESTTSQSVEKDHNKKIQEIRSKVAMTKQNVEKEYKDTISFLNALPKEKSNKSIKTAFMDEQRQQMIKDSRQQKLQQEYRKVEKECTKHSCRNKYHTKSRSPTKAKGDIFESTDFQYSWMPVPDGDGSLAVHTIPTTLKEGKSGNSVKFSKVDSYHEYRSRHKHTPPTKDTIQEKPKRNVEAVVIQNDSSDTDSVSSESSSLQSEKKDKPLSDTDKISDAERIIIYKILDSKIDKKTKASKLIEDIAKSLTLIQKQNSDADNNTKNSSRHSKKTGNVENRVSFEQLNEGVYKTVNENGDNIASMYFHDREGERTQDELKHDRPCSSNLVNKEEHQHMETGTHRHRESGDIPPSNTPRSRSSCTGDCKTVQPSTATSTSSFISKSNEKANNALADGGFIKLIDDGGQEAGKFYIGASGFLKDDAYEVVIQLRKKGDDRETFIEKSDDFLKKKETSTDNPEDLTKKKHQETLSLDKETVVTFEANAPLSSSEENRETNFNKMPSAATVSTVSDLPLDKKETSDGGGKNVGLGVQIGPNPKPLVIDSNQYTDKVIGNEPNNVSEKAVSTTLLDTNVVPTAVQKSEPIPRPATSTYTQTSMSSPNHRPVFFHMSSSTSTAYMSPPEMILPKFMRHDYQLTDEEINDRRNYKTKFVERHEYSDEHDCECRKCTKTHRCRKTRLLQNSSTPPNTARNAHTEDREQISHNNKKNMKSDTPPDINQKSKCKCRKCDRYGGHDLVTFSKSNYLAAKHSSQNFVLHVASSAASSNKTNQPVIKGSKSALKPVIKNYVDKLLVLNKESLKAVQVIDQECSSVTTPGSSIIDVPSNTDRHKPVLDNKLSLQQIQSMLKQKIVNDNKYHRNDGEISNHNFERCLKTQKGKSKVPKLHRKKTAHKVKTLNISRNLSRTKKTCDVKQSHPKTVSSSSSAKECVKEQASRISSRSKIRSKSSPTPRLPTNSETSDRSANSDLPHAKWNNLGQFSTKSSEGKTKPTRYNERKSAGRISASSNRDTLTSTSPDIGRIQCRIKGPSIKQHDVENPMSISTQTSINVDSEINYMKLAEDKLQNMEKIADLTEKCTQRLSNLAKVLEEVRKNKSLAYSQVSSSDTTSDTDQKSDKNINKFSKSQEPINAVNKRSESKSPVPTDTLKENDNTLNSTGYVPFLSNIPKPVIFKNINSDFGINSSSSSSIKSTPSPDHENEDYTVKSRGKPPPALSRINLKHGQDFVVPHELSTVVEVDSPLSVKMKFSRNDTKLDVPDTSSNRNSGTKKDSRASSPAEIKKGDANSPDFLDSNVEMMNQKHKTSATDSSDNSKIQMIDIKQFNDIMLKPFFSLQEYAKQCNVSALDDGSNLEDVLKHDYVNDEMSSLHSEASLPDVISELLKRNIISEPFKFDTGSNGNSTTVSSESTISVLALSKERQSKKRGLMFQNKENIGETSDTLSISSNPDLENAFKKLGMGWASSTLKKTKERLALSSSSNTSSSSLSQFKVKNFNQDIPALVTDTVSSILHVSKKPLQRHATDSSKNAQQQTSLSNSMTVKEFLTNELANKITFNNKSKNNTEEEFVSLFETKIPEEMKHSSRMICEENSIDNSMRSGNNNRARTSTPVQLFKSMTYHSSSSSNLSNGLFSNADDLSSVKVTSNSMKHSTSDKDDLIIPNFSLRMKRGSSECSKSD